VEYQNEEIVGYLLIPGTTIDYPITQTEDSEYYLHRDVYKNVNSAGWPFMDHENDPIADEDWNTIIYGHNMNKNYMFHGLRYFRDKAFYDAHKYAVYTSLYETQVWEVYAFCIANVRPAELMKFFYTRVFFDDRAQFDQLVIDMKLKSMYETGVIFEEGDRILSLSTCTNADPNDRYVLSLVPVKDMSKVPEDILKLLENSGENDV